MHGRCIVGLQVAGGKRAVVEPMHEHIAALVVGWYYAGEVEVGRTLFCARRLLVKPGVVGFGAIRGRVSQVVSSPLHEAKADAISTVPANNIGNLFIILIGVFERESIPNAAAEGCGVRILL